MEVTLFEHLWPVRGDLLTRQCSELTVVKGVEFGAGFAGVKMKGSENNDQFIVKRGKVITGTNNSGGQCRDYINFSYRRP